MSWGRADVATPYNALVDAFGQQEAYSLVHTFLEARGASDPGYELMGIEMHAQRQREERE
jgi:hypothetical protein